MKAIVVYRSKSGFTRKYAEWIAADLGADCFDCRKIAPRLFGDYEVIVFGGSLHKGGINGISVIRRNLALLAGKRLIVFVTGGSVPRAGIEEEILDANFCEDERKGVRLYYFRGGMDVGKLGILDKLMMIGRRRKLLRENPSELTETDRAFLAAFASPADGTDKAVTGPLVAYARS